MKKLPEEKIKKLSEKAKENSKYLLQALKFIGDYGKYKERKKYFLSDKEYENEMQKIYTHIYSIFHSYNIAIEIIKLFKKDDAFKEAVKNVNAILIEYDKAEQERIRNAELKDNIDPDLYKETEEKHLEISKIIKMIDKDDRTLN